MRKLFGRRKKAVRAARTQASTVSPVFEALEDRVLMTAANTAVAAVPGVEIDSGGPYGTYVNIGLGVTGTTAASRAYSGFGFVQAPISAFSPAYTITSVSDLYLSLHNDETSGAFAPVAGDFAVYVLPDNDTATSGPSLIGASNLTYAGGTSSTLTDLSAVGSNFGTDNAASLGLSGTGQLAGYITISSTLPLGYTTFTLSSLPPTVKSIIEQDFNGYDAGSGSTLTPLSIALVPSSVGPSGKPGYASTAATDGVNGAGGAILLGTFSFTNATIDTYTPATLSTAVINDIKTDLNSGTGFRFAVAPGSAAFAAEFYGGNGNEAPELSLTDTVVQNQAPEHITFDQPTVSGNEGTVINVQVDRSGANLTDTATVQFATSDGNASSTGPTPNYTATSGTLTFAPGVTSTTIPITTNVVTYASEQGGDKAFTITLSSVTTTSGSTIGVLGSGANSVPSLSDIVTVVDTSASTRVSLPLTETSDDSTVETTGPYASTGDYLEAAGTNSAHGYAGYVPMDFNDPAYAGYDAPNGQPYNLPTGVSISAIDSITTLTVGNSYGASNGLADGTSLGYFDLDKSATQGGTNPYTYSGADANPTEFTVTTTSTPEPATLGLIAMAGSGLSMRRRRRRA